MLTVEEARTGPGPGRDGGTELLASSALIARRRLMIRMVNPAAIAATHSSNPRRASDSRASHAARAATSTLNTDSTARRGIKKPCSHEMDIEPLLSPLRTRPGACLASHDHAVALPPLPIPENDITIPPRMRYLVRGAARAPRKGVGATFHGWNDAESAVLLAIAPGPARRLPAENLGGLAARCLPDAGGRRPPPERLPVRGKAHDPGHTRAGAGRRSQRA